MTNGDAEIEDAREAHSAAVRRAIEAGEAGDAAACLSALNEASELKDEQLWAEVAAGLQRWVEESGGS